jgi:hypothetical protein
MSNSLEQNQVESIFSKLELDCGVEKENKKLKEQIELLESKLQVLEQKEIERTKINPDVQTIVLYLHSDGVYMFCEEWQEKLFLGYAKTYKHHQNIEWGNGLRFSSIAGLYTQLLRLGFKFYHESKHYYTPNGTTLPTEVWIKGM